MGCPLAPVFAKIFMGFYESKWLNEYKIRYADDILAAFGNKEESLGFSNILTNRHPNIKFKSEK